MASAFARIERWMNDNGADAIVRNLAPGASDEDLADAEERLGFGLPTELRALWAVHDGQLGELDGLYESYDLLSSAEAHDEQMAYFVSEATASARAVATSGISTAEAASTHWLVIAARDSDGIVVNADTGRVFRLRHDDPPCLFLLAASVGAWLGAYADAVERDDYRVEEGFGEAYLERRDRDREARDAAREREHDAEAARRGRLEPVALMREATARASESMASEALSRAKRAAERAQVMDALFTGDPAFVATVLRVDLRSLTLSASEWRIVAKGGEKLGNNAIVAYARKMAGDG